MSKDVINISWSHLLSSSLSLASLAAQSVYYNLTIAQGSSSQEISLNETNYSFTLPEDAPSCEVYNFSVTAAYVGAIYTRASCSVSSAALSTMLPSLPSVKYLSDSINCHLVKLSQGLTLGVYFEVSHKLLFYWEHKKYVGLFQKNQPIVKALNFGHFPPKHFFLLMKILCHQ